MELDRGTCRFCHNPIERMDDDKYGNWFHVSSADSDACLSIGFPEPEQAPATCETCGMTAHPGADCPQVAGQ